MTFNIYLQLCVNNFSAYSTKLWADIRANSIQQRSGGSATSVRQWRVCADSIWQWTGLVWNHTYYTFYLNTVSPIPFISVNFLTTHPDSSVLRFNVTYFIFHFCHVTFYNSQLFMKVFPSFLFFLFWTLSLVNPTDTSLFYFSDYW